jgi:isochorismate synthase
MVVTDHLTTVRDRALAVCQELRQGPPARPTYLAVTQVQSAAADLVMLFCRWAERLCGQAEPVHYFFDPDTLCEWLAVGSVDAQLLTAGATLPELAQAWDDLVPRLRGDVGDVRGFFGFAFAPAGASGRGAWAAWPDARLVLPRLLLRRTAEGTVCTTAVAPVTAADDPLAVAERLELDLASATTVTLPVAWRDACDGDVTPDAAEEGDAAGAAGRSSVDWCAAVADTVDDIRNGRAQKVVLARTQWLATGAWSACRLERALRLLRAGQPRTAIYALTCGADVLVGASPERLARVEEGRIRVDCLAGTSSRPDGGTAADDEAACAALAASEKDLAEHAHVVSAVVQGLAEFVTSVDVPDRPRVMTLAHLHHLHTPVTGRLRAGSDLLHVLARLHPTPAVAGVPRAAAFAAIARRERMWRGWYAGGIGHVSPGGDGACFVALRCALWTRRGAHLFAGAGIVADSDPRAEWRETVAKLRTMRAALLPEGEDEDG